ncbi:MAG: hypothetical protein V1820_01575 [archaeon]
MFPAVQIPIEKRPGETSAYREYSRLGRGVLRTEVRVGPGAIALSFRAIEPEEPRDLLDLQILDTPAARYSLLPTGRYG